MNAIAKQAVAAVTDERFEAQPGYCQRWVRQVVQAVCGERYDAMMLPTARESGLAARRLGWEVKGPPRPGDLLYRLAGPGHVGIVVAGGRVAENATAKSGRVRGAVGYRTLAAWGRPEVIVRLSPYSAEESARRRAAYSRRLHRPLSELYAGLPRVLSGSEEHDALAALNAFCAVLTDVGCKPPAG